jgi:uncharacterized protein YbjT (DUF2867 family)
MYAITGITGKVGGELARTLLTEGVRVRAVLRDLAKATTWAARGCDIAVADMEDAGLLSEAFADTEAVFILPPSEFDPAPGFPEARLVIDAVFAALTRARPRRIVCLSTIGADAPNENLLTQRTLLEDKLGALDLAITFLRPAWFMENAAWDVAAARDTGVLKSFLQPADKAFPMVAAADVGRVAARLMQEDWTGHRIVDLEGAARISPNDIAEAFAKAVGHNVRVETVPRTAWEGLFRLEGMKNPQPRMRMLDGFNEGWIDFPEQGLYAVKGDVTLLDVITALVSERTDKSGMSTAPELSDKSMAGVARSRPVARTARFRPGGVT